MPLADAAAGDAGPASDDLLAQLDADLGGAGPADDPLDEESGGDPGSDLGGDADDQQGDEPGGDDLGDGDPADPDALGEAGQSGGAAPEGAGRHGAAPVASDEAVFSLLDKHGLGWARQKYGTADQAIQGLSHLAGMVGQQQEHSQLGRFVVSNPQQAAEWLAQHGYVAGGGQAAAPAGGQQAAQPAGVTVPEWDDAWAEYIDEETRHFKPGTPPEIVAKYRARQKWEKDFLKNPVATFNQVVDARLAEVKNPLEQKIAQLESQLAAARQRDDGQQWQQQIGQHLQQLAKPYRKHIYVDGDPSKGASEFGQILQRHLREAGEPLPNGGYRFQFVDDAWNYALLQAREEYRRRGAATRATANRPARPATAQAGGKPQQGRRSAAADAPLDLEQALLRDFKRLDANRSARRR